MAMAAPEQFLKTQQVAKALNVSVSTIKRWIDSGALAANRTVGKHRLVSETELRRFVKDQGLTFSPAILESVNNVERSLPGGPVDSPRLALIQALKNGDLLRARSIIQGLHESGISAAALGGNYIGPVMEVIGHGWEKGEVDIFQEHDATSILSTILSDFNQRLARNLVEPAPLALGATVEGDPYSLPLHLAELTLRELGWNVRNLGVNLPIDSLIKAIYHFKPRLVFICFNGETGLSVDALITQFLRLEETLPDFEATGLRIMLGGRKIPPKLLANLTRIEIGGSMTDLANLANDVAPRPSARLSQWL